ncbi:hypothetical protein Pint_22900 [Pistacia integerrima]|uniref:Uncharacterized protein n=1 Tax=Pistacia integerrima TaxID=434235 RepID=A0ACC0YMA1_9ROSI|nr:hypothetical protein Pint_22900 [Pistacia integerrima]
MAGKEECEDQKEHIYRSFSMPISSAQEGQPFAFGNQAVDPMADLSDQPLDFAPRFNHDRDIHMQSSYAAAHHDSVGTLRGVDPAAAVASVNSWNPPVASGVGYPPIPPALQSGPQHDPSIAIASVPGPVAPQFGRFPGPGFQPAIASASAFGLGAGAALHPSTAFPGDAYGVSSVSERPKKAPVPNWLKEEIIKNKAAITKSSLENPKEESESIDDESAPRSSGKGDQAESKSLDSSKSTEEEDDDEDYVEAARTAAINQEIKRILTEVLLKVTDELFDEIATKVLMEDDLTIEVEHNNILPNHKVSPRPPAVPTTKASAMVLVPVKAREFETEETSEKTSSSSPGDVLGLANYASDDDAGDDEIQNSSMPNSRNNAVRQSSTNKLSEEVRNTAENGSPVVLEEHNRGQTNLESDPRKSNASTSRNNDNGARDRDNENIVDSGKLLDGNNGFGLNITSGEKIGMKTKSELPGVERSANDNSQSTENRLRSVKNDRHESKKSSRKDCGKEIEIGGGAGEKGAENRRREDERHLRKEKADDRNGSRDKRKDYDVRPEEKSKESKSRKRSTHVDVKEDRRHTEKHHRSSSKKVIDKEHKQSKEEDSSRHKFTSDSSKHKGRRSSSVSSKGRNSKDNAVGQANESSDDTSDDSKRKPRSRKRNLSPSPDRSRRRQVMRSPHSKHSQRRHSPYSSLETTRGRSRSRSPVRRQR